jgi:hypothetical protein
MKTVAIKSKLDDANRLLAVAEQELETAMHALLSGRGDERTLVAKVLEDAFGKLREARREVVEMEKLLEEASETAGDG